MPMTVAELKEIVNVDITGVEIKDLDSLIIVYIDSSDESTSVNNAGDYESIESKICGDTLSSYFVFIADGSESGTMTYANLKKVLDGADDTDLVYFLSRLQTLPATDGEVKPVESAELSIIRLTSVNDGGSMTTEGVLTLNEIAQPCSSSSSSSS